MRLGTEWVLVPKTFCLTCSIAVTPTQFATRRINASRGRADPRAAAKRSRQPPARDHAEGIALCLWFRRIYDDPSTARRDIEAYVLSNTGALIQSSP